MGAVSAFQQRHEGKVLPSMEGEEAEARERIFKESCVPVSIKGVVIPMTEREALGAIGQIVSVLQARREGVMYNGRQ